MSRWLSNQLKSSLSTLNKPICKIVEAFIIVLVFDHGGYVEFNWVLVIGLGLLIDSLTTAELDVKMGE